MGNIYVGNVLEGRSHWPSGLRRVYTADRLLGLRIRIPPGAWMFVLCVLYSKDKKDKRHSQDNQDKEVMQSERKKKSRRGHGWLSGVSVVCVVK